VQVHEDEFGRLCEDVPLGQHPLHCDCNIDSMFVQYWCYFANDLNYPLNVGHCVDHLIGSS
jgi:hypothetical protein